MSRKLLFTLLTLLLLVMPVYGQTNDCDSALSEEEYLDLSIEQFQGRQYEDAIASTNCLLNFDDQNPTYYNNLGYFHYVLRNYDESLVNYETALSLAPDYVLGYVNRSLTYQALGQYEDALVDQNEAQRLDPDNANTYVVRASSFLYLGENENSVADFEQALELNPQSLGMVDYNDFAIALYRVGRVEEAIENVDIALEINPDYLQARENRGAFLLNIGEFEAAIAELTQVIESNPAFTDSFVFLGDALFELERYEEAKEAYEGFLENADSVPYVVDQIAEIDSILGTTVAVECDDDTSAEAYARVALEDFRNDRLQQAVDGYSCAIQADPENAQYLNDRGYMYFLLGDGQASFDDLSASLAIDPQYEQALMNLGNLQYEFSRYEEAIETLNRELAIDPTNETAQELIGMSYLQMGESATAEPFLLDAVDDTFIVQVRAMAGLAFAFYDQGEDENAFRAYEKLLQMVGEDNLEPFVLERIDDLEASLGRDMERAYICGGIVSTGDGTSFARDARQEAVVAFNDKDYEAAVEEYECVVKAYPFSASGLSSMGYFMDLAGDDEGAFAMYDRALELHPDDVTVYSTRATSFMDNGDFDSAFEDVDYVVSLAPDSAESSYLLGKWYLEQERYNEALLHYDTAVVLFQNVLNQTASDDIEEAKLGYELIELPEAVASNAGNLSFAYPDGALGFGTENDPSNIFIMNRLEVVSEGGIQLEDGDFIVLSGVGDAEFAGGEAGNNALDIIEGYLASDLTDDSTNPIQIVVNGYTGYEVELFNEEFGWRWLVVLEIAEDEYVNFSAILPNEAEFDAFKPTLIAMLQSFDLDDTPRDVITPVIVSAADIERSIELTEQGIDAQSAGSDEEAVELFTEAIEADPDNMEALIGRSNSLALLGRQEESLADTDAMLQIDPEFTDAFVQRAVLYYQLGELELALENINRYVELAGDDADPQTASFIEQVESELSGSVPSEADLDAAFELYQEGRALMDEGDIRAAIDKFAEASTLDPGQPIIFRYLGLSQAITGDFENAVDNLSIAIDLDPEYVGAIVNRANVFAELGELEDAVADYDSAIELEPESGDLYSQRAFILSKLGRDEEAVSDYEQALELDYETPTMLNEYGLVKVRLEEYEEGIDLISRAIGLNPVPIYFANRGMAHSFNFTANSGFNMMDDFECYELLAGDDADPQVVEEFERIRNRTIISGRDPITDASECTALQLR